MVRITQEKHSISFISIAVPHKIRISELSELKLMLTVSKKWRPIILRLFENINIKHNIMNNRITNWKLIENITVEVPNTASISKDILFHVSKFVEMMVFQLMFRIIKWIRQLQVRRQTVPNYWCQTGQFFWPEHMFLKGCFSFKTEDLVFAWFWPDCLYIS